VVHWDPIPKEYFQGGLADYNIQVHVYPPGKYLPETRTSKTSVVLKNLKDWKRYMVQVSAKGPQASYELFTGKSIYI